MSHKPRCSYWRNTGLIRELSSSSDSYLILGLLIIISVGRSVVYFPRGDGQGYGRRITNALEAHRQFTQTLDSVNDAIIGLTGATSTIILPSIFGYVAGSSGLGKVPLASALQLKNLYRLTVTS
jgi:hypothetical protein